MRSLSLAVLAILIGGAVTAQDVVAERSAPSRDARLADSGRPGPTVAVVGGDPDDGSAVTRAVAQIGRWEPSSGRILAGGASRARALAAGRRPELVIELAESESGADDGVKIEYGDAERGVAIARAIAAAIDAELGVDVAHLVLREAVEPSAPMTVSVAVPRAGRIATRTRTLRIAAHAALARLGVVEHGPSPMLRRPPDTIAVALFDDAGASGKGPGRLEALLDREHGFVLHRLCGADVRDGALAAFDVAVFPGGTGSGQAKSLGEDGRSAVRGFVSGGGGYVGICAGAYLAANNYTWSLKILDADVIDREHWKRGRGPVAVQWVDPARRVLAAPTRGELLYVNGPLYAPSGDDEIPDFDVLAWFRGEIRQNEAPVGVMRDTPAIVRGRFGDGVVTCSSPHPEQTDGMDDVVRELVRQAARRAR